MADKKITAADLSDALASVDFFHVIDDHQEHQSIKKFQQEDVFNNIPTF